MPSTRKSRKSRKIFLPKPQKGAMKPYSTAQPSSTRHKELEKQVKEHGYATVVRDLNLRATMNRSNPDVAKTMKADMAYLKKEYRGARSRRSRRSRK